MKNKMMHVAVATLAGLFATLPAWPLERTEIPEQYTWNLADLYADAAAWEAARVSLGKEIPKLAQWQGKLGTSAGTLLAALAAREEAVLAADRLRSYASQLSDQDTRVSQHMEMQQQADQVFNEFRTTTAYYRPEILQVGRARIEQFLAQEPKLGQYRMMLDDILRSAPHTLSPQEEKIAARAGAMATTGANVHSVFTNADLPYPQITLSTGEKVRLDAAGYARYRASPVKADRDAVFQAFWGRYGDFTRTLATTLDAQVRTHEFNRDVHKFGSSLEAALFEYNIPVSVYTRLIEDVHANLPTLHRYLRLRQKIMGLPSLGYEDLYAPMVDEVELTYTPEQAKELTLQAFAPLGPEYVAALRKGYESRWVDFMPNTGKRSGAYSTMVYGVHPYQLLNFNGAWDDVSTLAHESGHSMHSYLSSAAQPYATADYSIFVAEVASTLNESLLFHHELDRTTDDRTRLFLLSSYLDTLRQTLFRQTLFAEFELRIHEMVERGEALTSESLSALYLGLLRKYYGHDQGVVQVVEPYGAEWAYIPHFYFNFYVYQYATSMIGGMTLSENIIGSKAVKSGTSAAGRDAYLNMLKAGSSKYPVELLKDAGVDMTTSQPFEAAIREMNRIMDEMEAIYARQKK